MWKPTSSLTFPDQHGRHDFSASNILAESKTRPQSAVLFPMQETPAVTITTQEAKDHARGSTALHIPQHNPFSTYTAQNSTYMTHILEMQCNVNTLNYRHSRNSDVVEGWEHWYSKTKWYILEQFPSPQKLLWFHKSVRLPFWSMFRESQVM